MPQLMPIFWKNSIFMISLFVMVMVLIYYLEKEIFYNCDCEDLSKVYLNKYMW